MSSIGQTAGILGSAAGAPLSQSSKSTESEQRESAATQRKTDADMQAEKASGIGQTEEDQETGDRDADGRRLWEKPQDAAGQGQHADDADAPPASKDTTGQTGTSLDLFG